MKYLITLTLFFFIYYSAFTQGKLMLVGGGTELDDSWSWSNQPYKWAVDQSANKKVAIIAFGESGDPQWLPDYFVSLGAIRARNFVINTNDSANSQLTYDTLMNYDVLFFKGGDQSNYYTTYKNTKVTEAMTDKYAEGGVIAGTSAGMAILSEVVYTAESGTLYPDQALENIQHPNIDLRNDFVDLLNGYVVDTHFVERGRLPRLAAFIGNWFLNENQEITGIGVDDRTAFCIDENNIGTAYGTGAITLISTDNFGQGDNKPVSDSINMVSLLHNQQYNLSNQTIINELSAAIEAEIKEESGKFTAYLSGSNNLNDNQNLLLDALQANDSVIVVSNNQNSLVNDYIDYLENEEITVFPVYVAESSDSCFSALARNLIRLSDKFIFLENDLSDFSEFLSGTATGKVLNKKIREDESTSIFFGEDTKLAGANYVTNNKGNELNAYNGNLEFTEGVGLLKTTTIIPDAYDPTSPDFYENNTASALYMLGAFNLKYAALINQKSYLKYFSENDSTWFDNAGNYSAMLISNNAQTGGFADQQVNSNGDVRQVTGYDQLKISLIYNTPIFIGNSLSNNSDDDISLEIPTPSGLKADYTDVVSLSWTDNSLTEESFRIERRTSSNDFDLIVELPANSEQYIDTNLEKGETYEYRIQAVNDDRVSCFSEIAITNTITSTYERADNGISIYPNPVLNGKISIKCNFDGYAEIYNQFGQKLLYQKINKGITTLKVDELPSGILYLRLGSMYKNVEENYFSILNTK